MHRNHGPPLLLAEPLEDRLAPAAGDLDPMFGAGGEPATFQDLDPFGATVPAGVFVG